MEPESRHSCRHLPAPPEAEYASLLGSVFEPEMQGSESSVQLWPEGNARPEPRTISVNGLQSRMRDSSVDVRICEGQGRAAEIRDRCRRSSPFPRADEKLASKLASANRQANTNNDPTH